MLDYIKIIILILSVGYSQTFLLSDYDYTNQDYTYQQVWRLSKSYKNRLTYDEVETVIRHCIIYEINPIYVLSRMQLETDLVFDNDKNKILAWSKHRAMGYGLYIHVRRDGLKMYKYGGYDIQVSKAIEKMRKLFDEYREGSKVTVTDLKASIIPDNAATYATYRYTPFYGVHNEYEWDNAACGNKCLIDILERIKSRWKSIKD